MRLASQGLLWSFPRNLYSRLAEAIRCEARESENIAEQTRKVPGRWVMMPEEKIERYEREREMREGEQKEKEGDGGRVES